MSSKKEYGQRGETLAAHFLRAKGYTILETNWRAGRAEVDIIAQHEQTLCFIEVKTRNSQGIELAEETVSQAQQNRLIRAADHYLEAKQPDGDLRFDIIGITLGDDTQINHLEGAFESEW